MADHISDQTATVLSALPPTPGTASRPAIAAFDEGRFVPGTLVAGRYRIISLLGRGGMGEVYRATDLTLGQPVALKFLPETGGEFQRSLERFHNEVRTARQVSHPNVCRVYDIGEVDGVPYISMEYVDGEDLESLLKRIGRLPYDKALDIARKVCAGIAAAHDKGVIHRDLKPANVMLDRRGNAVIMDFGLAAAALELSGPEAFSGTPAYMAPEQLRGEAVSTRSDIYSLGLMLFELFTGKRVFEAKSRQELIRLQESATVPAMTSSAPEVEPAVEQTIRRCLDPDPGKRPSSALLVSAALPGGDPLSAALAAGETPSPELVAASGLKEGLRMNLAAPIAIAAVLGVLTVALMRHAAEAHAVSKLELPPEALAAKARGYAETFGYNPGQVFSAWGLRWYPTFAGQANRAAARGSKTTREVAEYLAKSPAMGLIYRESPLPLIALPDGEITMDQPAPTMYGMIEIGLDANGHLRRFLAVPDQKLSSNPPAPIDPQLISRATGFDLSGWEETSPPVTPLYATDWIKTWKGKVPGTDLDVKVEVSAWRGRLTELYILWPFTSLGRVPEFKSRDGVRLAFDIGTLTLGALLLVFSGVLAFRNLRLGRGDRSGALRLAMVQFVVSAVVWSLRVHWMPDPAMAEIVVTNIVAWIGQSALLWTLYIALEPALRSRWPHAIVTWNRLLAGRFSDPRVGAHILFGTCAGSWIGCFLTLFAYLNSRRGAITQFADPEFSLSFGRWFSSLVVDTWNGVQYALIGIFAIFCIRMLLRRDWLAALAAAALFTAREWEVWENGEWATPLIYLLIFSILAFAMLRTGMVASMTAIFVASFLVRLPGFQNFTHYYEWSVIASVLALSGLAGWSFWNTAGRRAFETNTADPVRV